MYRIPGMLARKLVYHLLKNKTRTFPNVTMLQNDVLYNLNCYSEV